MKKLTTLAFAFLLLLGSCVYPYDIQMDDEVDLIPVVDGRIVAGDKATLSINWVLPLNVRPNKAKIRNVPYTWWVIDSNGKTYHPTESLPNQVPMTSASGDLQYKMHLEMLDAVYESEWMGSVAPPIVDSISIWADEKKVNSKATLRLPDSATGYIAISTEETWEFHADLMAEWYIDTEDWSLNEVHDPSVINYYCWISSNSKEELIMDLSRFDRSGAATIPFNAYSRSDSRNHKRYTVLFIVRSLTEEEYRYRSNMKTNKEAGNDIFTPNPGQMLGNVRCISDESLPIMGYVSVSRSNSCRKWMDDRFYIPTFWSDDFFTFVEEEEYENYYTNWEYRPVRTIVQENVVKGVGWAPARCVDCVLAGGTKEKPSLWEE